MTQPFPAAARGITIAPATGDGNAVLIELPVMLARFGPLAFAMAVVLEPGRMSLVHVGWRIFGIPMPRFLAPRVVAYEEVRDGKFNFHVRVMHPLCGLIVQYDGWLAREN